MAELAVGLSEAAKTEDRGRHPHGGRGFSALYVVLAVVVAGFIGIAAVLVAGSRQSSSGGTLVPIGSPQSVKVDNQAGKPADGPPSGYQAYSNAQLGFSFNYPESWGTLAPAAGPASILNLATPKIQAYSLADDFEVSVEKQPAFQVRADDLGVYISPTSNGAGFDWKVAVKGGGTVSVGRPYQPAPVVFYQSGNATVYNFLDTQGNCSHNEWVFPVQGDMVRLRLPSFCISDKPGDSDVQAGDKADFDAEKQQVLQSIIVQ